jgi:Plasmid encoded RepA protein
VRDISPPARPVAAALRASLIDRRIQEYADQQMSRQAILERLLASRWPLEQLKARFAEFPESAFRYSDNPTTPTASKPPASPALPSVAPPSVDRALVQAVTAAEGISFQYVPLIQCSFPHADPKHATTFTRKNGWLELTRGTTRPEAGLPYGVPARLLTIYCTSEAVRTNSPEIYLGDSVHDFLRRLDVPITRGTRGSLSVYANQLLRLIHSTVSIDENIRDGAGRSGLHIRQALFVEEARLWWDDPEHAASRTGRRGGQGGIANGSSLMLSSVLFHSILERSAPLATHAIKQLRKSPMDLDVYAWLVHRLFHLSKPSLVSWEQLSSQFGHSYREPRTFRRFFLDSLKRVSKVYPDAKLKVCDPGVLLLPSRPHLANSKAALKR